MRKTKSEEIYKSSLSRIWRHSIGTGKVKQFTMLSAETGQPNTPEGRHTNNERTAALHRDLSKMGYGFIRVRGHWVDQSTKQESIEHSVMVPGMSLGHAKKLMAKYGQQAVIHGRNNQISLHSSEGTKQGIGEFHPEHLAQAYSEYRGKQFTFKGFEWIPNSWMEAALSAKNPVYYIDLEKAVTRKRRKSS